MLQTAPLKVPVKPSYVKFAKGTPSARFLKFCKVGTRANYCKKKARKNTLAPMPSCPNYDFLEVPTLQTILLQTAPLKVPVKPSYVKFAKGTPSAFSEILQSWAQGKLLQKEGQKKHPGANAIIS